MKVHLYQPHTHAGKRYEAGAEVDLPRDAIDWLREHTTVLQKPADGTPSIEAPEAERAPVADSNPAP